MDDLRRGNVAVDINLLNKICMTLNIIMQYFSTMDIISLTSYLLIEDDDSFVVVLEEVKSPRRSKRLSDAAGR